MMEQYTTNVTSVYMLDEEFASQFSKPYLLEFPDGRIEEFDTEDEACKRQRDLEPEKEG